MTATWSVNRQLFKENAKNVKQDNQIMAVVKIMRTIMDLNLQ